MNYNYLSEPDKILSILDLMGADSFKNAVTAKQLVAKGIEEGATKDIFTENWHGHEESDHPWWLLLAAMSGVGSEAEVAKYNVPHLHRRKVKAVTNTGRKTNVMVYWYDESHVHTVTYTGKEYKAKMERQKEIHNLLVKTQGLPKSKEERIAQMRKDPNFVELDGHFFKVSTILSNPTKYNPVVVALAMNQSSK